MLPLKLAGNDALCFPPCCGRLVETAVVQEAAARAISDTHRGWWGGLRNDQVQFHKIKLKHQEDAQPVCDSGVGRSAQGPNVGVSRPLFGGGPLERARSSLVGHLFSRCPDLDAW